MKSLYLIDLDNCISDDRWRRVPHLEHRPDGTFATPGGVPVADPDGYYHHYNCRAYQDEPVNLHILKGALSVETDDAELLIVTARPEKYRPITEQWLRDKCGVHIHSDNILMRPEGNHSPSPELKVNLVNDWITDNLLEDYVFSAIKIFAYDDRADVLFAYEQWAASLEIKFKGLQLNAGSEARPDPIAEVLRNMAATAEERGKVYGHNFYKVAPMVAALFPDGVPQHLIVDHRWHLFELILVKLSRFATSELTHVDSIHDAAVYAAIIESVINESRHN